MRKPGPDQAVMLLHTVQDTEAIAPPERQLTVMHKPIPAEVSAELVARNEFVYQALGKLGTIAETQPAIDADTDPEARAALKIRFWGDYDQKVASMKVRNAVARKEFVPLFEKMWGMDIVKKSGLLTDQETKEKFEQDKSHFEGRYLRSEGHTAHEAKLARNRYRYKLRRQRKVYEANNVGVWPPKAATTRRRKSAARPSKRAA